MVVQVKSAKAWETTGPEAQQESLREDVVAAVAGELQARLLQVERLALVAAIHGQLAKETTEKAVVTVTASAVVAGRVSSATVVRECSAPGMVAETVDLLVRAASPELWAQIRAVLEASDSDLAAMVAVNHRAP